MSSERRPCRRSGGDWLPLLPRPQNSAIGRGRAIVVAVPLTDRGITVLRGHPARVRNGFESFEDTTFHRSQAHREHPARTKRSTRNLGVLPACRLASLSACDYYPAIC